MAEQQKDHDRPATHEIAAGEASESREFDFARDDPSRDVPEEVPVPDQDATAPFARFEREMPLINPLADARPFALPSFDNELSGSPAVDAEVFCDDEVEVHVELGRALLPPGDDESLRSGTVIPLDKLAADPVDVVVDGRLVARGEVLVINDKLCIRIAEVPGSTDRFEMSTERLCA